MGKILKHVLFVFSSEVWDSEEISKRLKMKSKVKVQLRWYENDADLFNDCSTLFSIPE